ncbi:MAG: IS1634 family transposase [Candidatus Bipolaricaulota bacterium]|nr:IS1634 family transposase [Candidatus Bipolaricaulota bacterium]MDW8127314.1 IS1634 family transposase [Candidatus Bipolaricaulota bacterium]
MYIRVKRFANKDGSVREYLYIVKAVREGGKVRQKVVAYLGRVDELQKEGTVDALLEGLVRYAQEKEVIDTAQDLFCESAKEYGPLLVFRKLWRDLGLEAFLTRYVAERGYEFPVVDAMFAMVVNRLLAPCSKLSVFHWIEEVEEPAFRDLALHHFYRAMDVLYANKERLEEDLFRKNWDLFSQEVDLAFFDTTTVSFQGEGPEGLAEYGYSRARRPDLRQIVVAVVMTKGGFPIAHEIFPGSTSDLRAFPAVIRRVKERFRLGRVIVVSDRGTVSEENLGLLEELGLPYIVGVRMRKAKEVAEEVLSWPGRYQEVAKNLKVKEVHREDKRYIVCLNEEEAERDRKAREETVALLEEKLAREGIKGFVGNKGYRRFLKVREATVEIDEEKLREEARYDGKYVLLTNTELPAAEVALAYKGLWQVEQAFRELKDQLEVEPVYHWTEPRVRAHVAICFLAFLLEVELRKRLEKLGVEASFREVLRDLRRVKAVELRVKERMYRVRTELQGQAYSAFQAAGIAPPKRVVSLPVVATSPLED